jgi:PAS domain S-box-containing protein
MFKLLRYFSVTSAIAILAIAGVLLVVFRGSAERELVSMTENHNAALAKTLANSVWIRFGDFLESASGRDGNALRAAPEHRQIDEELRSLANGVAVLKVKIYHPGGLTVYSSEASQIGEDKSTNPGFITATSLGRPVSKLSFRETFSAFSGEIFRRDVVETYAPIKGPDGRLLGVFELYTDVTSTMDAIVLSTIYLFFVLLAVLAALYGFLFLIVRHASRVMDNQFTALQRHDKLLEIRTVELGRQIEGRKKSEGELESHKNLLESLINNIPAPVFFKDGDFIYRGCNKAFEEFIGRSRDDIIGQGVYDVAPKDLADVYLEADRSLAEQGGIQVYDAKVRYADGTDHDVIFHKAVFDNPDGSLGGLVGVMLDITERKKAETALRDSEIRHRGFAADIAHELRTPLSILRLHLEDLGGSEAVDMLRRDVGAMSRLVEQLLALARLDNIPVDIDDTTDLREICVDVAAQFAPLTVKEGRSIEVVGADRPITVPGDADSVEQAVRNLVENAIKFSGEGTTVTLKIDDDKRIAVIDHGPGVPTEMREMIFERFRRSDERSSGSGLGLHIARRIVEAYDGSIEVSDTPGGGATFTIDFSERPVGSMA